MTTGNDVAVGRTKVIVLGHSYVQIVNIIFTTAMLHTWVLEAPVASLRTQAVLCEVRRTSPDVAILHVGGLA